MEIIYTRLQEAGIEKSPYPQEQGKLFHCNFPAGLGFFVR